MGPDFARKRSDAPPVKHGCALEGGKMLNCVGILGEKQKTWLDWLTTLLWWDTIRRKPVSLKADRVTKRWFVCPGRQSVCDDVVAT